MTDLFLGFPQESREWLVNLAKVGLNRCLNISQGDGRDYPSAIQFLTLLDELGDLPSVVVHIGDHCPSMIIEASLNLLSCRQSDGSLITSLQQAGFTTADFEQLNIRLVHLQKHAWENSVKALAIKIGTIEGYN